MPLSEGDRQLVVGAAVAGAERGLGLPEKRNAADDQPNGDGDEGDKAEAALRRGPEWLRGSCQ